MAEPENGDHDELMRQNHPEERRIIEHVSAVGQQIVTGFQESTNAMLTQVNQMIHDASQERVSSNPNVHSQPMIYRPLPPPDKLQLQQENERLKELLQLADAKQLSLDTTESHREYKIKELELALNKSRQESKRLNSIIIRSGTPTAGPSDDQIRLNFIDIRDSILRIVRNHYQATSVSLMPLRKEPTTQSQRQHQWLGNYNRSSAELRNYLVQGAIFFIIDKQMFSRPIFGVDEEMECSLGDFEEEMEGCKDISKADLVEWRRRTVTAARSLQSVSGGIAERTAKKIQDTLEPARTQPKNQVTRVKVQELEREVSTLCDRAFQLALLLRSTRAVFRVVNPTRGTAIVLEDCDIEVVAVEGRVYSPIDRVAFSVSGGLQKLVLAPEGGEDIIRLEKAYVVGLAG